MSKDYPHTLLNQNSIMVIICQNVNHALDVANLLDFTSNLHYPLSQSATSDFFYATIMLLNLWLLVSELF